MIKLSVYDKIYIFLRWRIYTPIVEFPKDVKYFIQRGRRGYSDADVWSFHTYLARVISGGLKNLSEDAHGCPCDFVESETDEAFDVAFEAWKTFLVKLSKSFEDHANDVNLDLWHEDYKKYGSEYANMKDKDRQLKWKKDKELFIEHFESFWD